MSKDYLAAAPFRSKSSLCEEEADECHGEGKNERIAELVETIGRDP
jgi:hypothetical protein